MSKYTFQSGYSPDIQAAIVISGPQTEEMLPSPVLEAFEADERIKQVVIVYTGDTGRDKIDVWSKLDSTKGSDYEQVEESIGKR